MLVADEPRHFLYVAGAVLVYLGRILVVFFYSVSGSGPLSRNTGQLELLGVACGKLWL